MPTVKEIGKDAKGLINRLVDVALEQQDEINGLKDENKKIGSHGIKKAEAEADELRKKFSLASSKASDLQSKVEELVKENKILVSSNKNLMSENDDLTKKAETIKAALA